MPAATELAGAGLKEEQREFVLALRGLLAYGVLEHCLRMRVHVEFGINRCGFRSVDRRAGGQQEPQAKWQRRLCLAGPQAPLLLLSSTALPGTDQHWLTIPLSLPSSPLPPRSPNARKRLAVPYRAAHTPSERSEYARPDTALTLTALAYYKDGLSLDELLDAVHELLKRGQNEQRACYAEWLQLARLHVADAGGQWQASGCSSIGRGWSGSGWLPVACWLVMQLCRVLPADYKFTLALAHDAHAPLNRFLLFVHRCDDSSGRCAQAGPNQRCSDGPGPLPLLAQHGGWVPGRALGGRRMRARISPIVTSCGCKSADLLLRHKGTSCRLFHSAPCMLRPRRLQPSTSGSPIAWCLARCACTPAACPPARGTWPTTQQARWSASQVRL